LRRQLVEAAHRGGAHAGVHAGKDVQHLALAGMVGQRDLGQVAADQMERRRLAADRREAAVDAYRLTLEMDCGHDAPRDGWGNRPTSRTWSWPERRWPPSAPARCDAYGGSGRRSSSRARPPTPR